MKCERCGNELRIGNEQVGFDFRQLPLFHRFGYCDNCRIKWDLDANNITLNNQFSQTTQPIHKHFQGVYRYTMFGNKKEVYCPRCNSENCSHYQEQRIIPGKTKTTYSANLNPLKPFTIVNKKEKVIREAQTQSISKFICNSCGFIFN